MHALRTVRRLTSRGSDEIYKCLDSIRSRRHPNAIFLWLPKTAGTSVYEMLRPCGFVKLKSVRDVRLFFASKGRVTFGHMSLAALIEQRVVDRSFVADAFKFTVVRDPYARAVSCYNHLGKRGYFEQWLRKPTFTEFLEIIGSGFIERVGARNNAGLAFCNPQNEWLRGVEIDRVFKVETLADEVPVLRELFECPELELGHANRSSGIRLDDLTARDRQMVEEIYRDDFERFGYPRR